MSTLNFNLPQLWSLDSSAMAWGNSLAQSKQMNPWMMARLMMILEQFLILYLFEIYSLYELMAPQAMMRLQSRICISSSSSISPPTLSKQTLTPLGQYSFSFSLKFSVLQLIAASAPIDLMYWHFSLEPTIPTTVHPAFLASCTAISPTAPAAAETTTVYPAFRLPIFLSPKQAVSPEMPKTPKKFSQLGQFWGRGVRSLALRTEYFCQQVRPKTLSPILNLGSLEKMTSATPIPFIKSPGLTGSMQVLTPEIHTLWVASIERNMFLTTTSPGAIWSVGTGGTNLI